MLQGALKYLGLRSKVIAAIACVEHAGTHEHQQLGACAHTPALRSDGHTDGHAVLWLDPLHRLIDPVIMLSQNLQPMLEDEDIAVGGPVVLGFPYNSFLTKSIHDVPIWCCRASLLITWTLQPRWTHALTPVPGSDLASGLAYGKLALTYATLELIQGLGDLELRSDISQLRACHPVLASLINGSSRLPALPETPPEAFLRICHRADVFENSFPRG